MDEKSVCTPPQSTSECMCWDLTYKRKTLVKNDNNNAVAALTICGYIGINIMSHICLCNIQKVYMFTKL